MFDFQIQAANPAVDSLIMKRYIIIFLLISCGCKTIPPKSANLDLSTLPGYGAETWNHKGPVPASVYTWNLGAFIPVAMSLQAMGREAGSRALLRTASEASEDNTYDEYEKVVVLCRMLFKFKDGVTYRYPSLGERFLYGKTTLEDWPTEPIEVVDGYPFWIVQGLGSGGARSPHASYRYVTYCITNCEWNTFKYRPLSVEEKRAALAKLLNSKKWKSPLTEMDRWLLSSQIE